MRLSPDEVLPPVKRASWRRSRICLGRADGDDLTAQLAGARDPGRRRSRRDGSSPRRARRRSRCCPGRASPVRVSSSLRLSRWCRPMDGSSRMYSTPVSRDPICVASRMRCPLAAGKRGRLAVQRQVTRDRRSTGKPEALADLLEDRPGEWRYVLAARASARARNRSVRAP